MLFIILLQLEKSPPEEKGLVNECVNLINQACEKNKKAFVDANNDVLRKAGLL
jgi:hypothetical protein